MTTTPGLESFAPIASDHRARRSVLVAFAIQGLTFASIVTRLPTFKDKFDLSDLQILVLLAAVAVASGLGSLAAGYAAQRWGSAVTVRNALLGVSVCAGLIGFSGSLWVLVLVTSLYGLCVGAADAALNIQGVAVQDRYGRSIMTGFHAMWSGAAVVGAIYASVAIEVGLGLIPSMLIVAVVGLALNRWSSPGLLRHVVLDAGDATGPTDHHVPWLPIVLIAIPTTVMWLSDSAASVWSGIYLEDGLGAAASVAPIAYAAYQFVLLVVRLVGDRFVRRYGARDVVRVSGITATVGLLLIVVAPGLPLVLAGFALLGGGLALIPPLSYVAAAHLDVVRGSQAIARVNLANYLGYILAAFGIAIVAETAGNRWMFVVPLILIPLVPLMARQFAPHTTPVVLAADAAPKNRSQA
ncbi:MFS transporter [Knoellia sp. S7-12]|uniref:MFS transporter n=1 Tax=Knoellia sp. S7-12 TaxID=3126698 RepID=UPI003367FC71